MRASVTFFQRSYRALTEPQLAQLREAKWKIGNDVISKRFAMPTHTLAAAFALRVARKADEINHHPEIKIKYRFVSFELRTNDTNELTTVDEELAYHIDKLRNVE